MFTRIQSIVSWHLHVVEDKLTSTRLFRMGLYLEVCPRLNIQLKQFVSANFLKPLNRISCNFVVKVDILSGEKDSIISNLLINVMLSSQICTNVLIDSIFLSGERYVAQGSLVLIPSL